MKFHEYILYGLGVIARTHFSRTYARTEGRTRVKIYGPEEAKETEYDLGVMSQTGMHGRT